MRKRKLSDKQLNILTLDTILAHIKWAIDKFPFIRGIDINLDDVYKDLEHARQYIEDVLSELKPK